MIKLRGPNKLQQVDLAQEGIRDATGIALQPLGYLCSFAASRPDP